MSAAWAYTSAPSRSAISPVPSCEASTTTTSSTAPSSRSRTSDSTIGPMVRASSRAGTHTDIEQSRSAASCSGGKWEWWRSVPLRLVDDHVANGRVEALLGLRDEPVLEPVLLAARVREEHDLVGVVGHERVLQGEQRVLLAGVARGVDAGVVETLDGLLLHGLGALDRGIGVGEEEALLRVQRGRDDEHLGAVGVLLAHCGAKGVGGHGLGYEGEDLLGHAGVIPDRRHHERRSARRAS